MSEQEVTGFRRSVGDIHARTEDTHRRYPKAESLLGYAQRQAEKSSGLFTTSFIGEKVLKRPILRMDSAPANTTIRVVFIAAVHGDEPDAALALTYHATELFKRATEKNISLTIIPVTNVEGYNAGYQGCPELGKIADDNQSKKKFNLNRN